MKPGVFQPDVPPEWEAVRLGEIAEVRPGGRLGLTKEKDYAAEGVPAYSAAGQDGFVRTEEGRGRIVILSSIGARCGKTFLTGDSWTSLANTQLIIPGPRVDAHFLHAYTNDERFWVRSGSAQPFIKTSTISGAWIALPPLVEQGEIAAILGNVDDAIAASRQVIEQTKRVKQGLLQTIMTRGIGHTRFKRTEIGTIPESWEVLPLESLLAESDYAMRSGPFGSALLKRELVSNGIPLLGIDNIHEEEFRSTYSRFVSPEKFRELRRYAVRPRDVVITIMGTIGRTCVVPTDLGPALSSKHLWTMTFDTDRYMPELVSLQLNWAPWVQRHFRSQSQGGVMKAIRSDVLKTTPLPVPPMEEQMRIAAILESCRAFQEIAVSEATLLEQTKRGLMQDLLTGRVRVQPD